MGVLSDVGSVEEWRIKAAAFLPPADLECRDGQVAIYEYAARPSSAPKARSAMRAFLEGCELGLDKVAEILTAAGEAVANSIEHAYDPRLSGPFFLSLYCCTLHRRIVVEIRDRGTMRVRDPNPTGRGFGTLIMKALPTQVTFDTSSGTVVTMLFRH